jgi:hypothetical protein
VLSTARSSLLAYLLSWTERVVAIAGRSCLLPPASLPKVAVWSRRSLIFGSSSIQSLHGGSMYRVAVESRRSPIFGSTSTAVQSSRSPFGLCRVPSISPSPSNQACPRCDLAGILSPACTPWPASHQPLYSSNKHSEKHKTTTLLSKMILWFYPLLNYFDSIFLFCYVN